MSTLCITNQINSLFSVAFVNNHVHFDHFDIFTAMQIIFSWLIWLMARHCIKYWLFAYTLPKTWVGHKMSLRWYQYLKVVWTFHNMSDINFFKTSYSKTQELFYFTIYRKILFNLFIHSSLTFFYRNTRQPKHRVFTSAHLICVSSFHKNPTKIIFALRHAQLRRYVCYTWYTLIIIVKSLLY